MRRGVFAGKVHVLLAMALLVSGCASSVLSETEKQTLAEAASAPETLQPGDKIKVVVFGEQGLGGEYELDQAGQISVPLAGTLKVRGMTQAELEQTLAKRFRSQYLQGSKSHRDDCVACALLHYRGGQESGPKELQERPQCAHRDSHRRWSHIPSKPQHS